MDASAAAEDLRKRMLANANRVLQSSPNSCATTQLMQVATIPGYAGNPNSRRDRMLLNVNHEARKEVSVEVPTTISEPTSAERAPHEILGIEEIKRRLTRLECIAQELVLEKERRNLLGTDKAHAPYNVQVKLSSEPLSYWETMNVQLIRISESRTSNGASQRHAHSCRPMSSRL